MKFFNTLLLTLFILSSTTYAENKTTTIHIETIPGLKYNVKKFFVKPGTVVKLIIKNNDMMLHNLVFTKPGARESIVEAALKLGADGPAKSYVPDSPDVLWSTKVIEQMKTVELNFTAPENKGEYPYVCTYPGHGYVMFGSMVVSDKTQPMQMDGAGSDSKTSAHAHHEPLKTPTVRRFFLPDTGPASIAVALPGNQSYAWDTGACRFRYAWSGGFIQDINNLPQQLPKSAVKIEGKVFYSEQINCPIRLSEDPNKIPHWQFLGYRLDKEGYPEFEYKIGDLIIIETVEIENKLISRHFKTSGKQRLWFHFDPKTKTQINSTGKKLEQAFQYTPSEAKNFTVRITI